MTGVRLVGWVKKQAVLLMATLTPSGRVEYRVAGSYSMLQMAEA